MEHCYALILFFFGEDVPLFEIASRIVEHADILIVVGTSLAVCPAAALVLFTRDENVPIYFVDPVVPDTAIIQNPLTHINERGGGWYGVVLSPHHGFSRNFHGSMLWES